MAKLDLYSKDYVPASLESDFSQDDVEVIKTRLTMHRGKWWRNKNLGSRLYQLAGSKDVKRNIRLAKQYADEALQDLVPARFLNIEVSAAQNESSRIDLKIEVTTLTGHKQNIIHFVQVGG